MLRSVLIMLVSFYLIFFMGCEKDGMIANETSQTILEFNNYTLLTGDDFTDDFRNQNSDKTSLEFKVIDAFRTTENGQEFLQVEIEYPYCDTETRFDWVGRTAQLRGQSPHIFLFVQLVADKEFEEENQTETEIFLVDLFDIFDKETAKHADFTIQNISSFEADDKRLNFSIPLTAENPTDS